MDDVHRALENCKQVLGQMKEKLVTTPSLTGAVSFKFCVQFRRAYCKILRVAYLYLVRCHIRIERHDSSNNILPRANKTYTKHR